MAVIWGGPLLEWFGLSLEGELIIRLDEPLVLHAKLPDPSDFLPGEREAFPQPCFGGGVGTGLQRCMLL